jgi:NitT/TauT family transport system ATP-binding protein
MTALHTQGLASTARTVHVQGHDPFRKFDWFRGKIGTVFQNDRLLPWRTALDNVVYGVELSKTPPHEREPIGRHWLGKLGLVGYEDSWPHALSGGMKQRVSIARAFALAPEIPLCDEPFSALDELTGAQLRAEFLALVRESAKTSLFITHSLDEALQVGQRVLVFCAPGQVVLDLAVPAGATAAAREDMKQRIREAMASPTETAATA